MLNFYKTDFGLFYVKDDGNAELRQINNIIYNFSRRYRGIVDADDLNMEIVTIILEFMDKNNIKESDVDVNVRRRLYSHLNNELIMFCNPNMISYPIQVGDYKTESVKRVYIVNKGFSGDFDNVEKFFNCDDYSSDYVRILDFEYIESIASEHQLKVLKKALNSGMDDLTKNEKVSLNRLKNRLNKDNKFYNYKYRTLHEASSSIKEYLRNKECSLKEYVENVMPSVVFEYIKTEKTTDSEMLEELKSFVKYVESFNEKDKYLKEITGDYDIIGHMRSIKEENEDVKVFFTNAYGIIIQYLDEKGVITNL